ncbi:MAG TPA: glycine cleavage system protein H [Anaeromyxobacteraceae bacterium]|nr:glycine cleavage system protein H [Anaeromyxobacteraceae bacterium]
MTTATEILEALGAILGASIARFGIAMVVGLALVVPALLIALARKAWADRRARDEKADGLAYRRGAWYAPNHTWLATRGPGELKVGLDDLARRILPSATAVELPRPGLRFRRGDPIAVVSAGKHTVHVAAPVDGTVVDVNSRVKRDPALVRRDPYGGGWLFSIAPVDAEYVKLPQGNEAVSWLRSEKVRLTRFVEDELGFAAADGGEAPPAAPATLGEEGWRKVVFSFLHAT